MITEWADFLHHGGVLVYESIKFGRHDAVIDVINVCFKPSVEFDDKEAMGIEDGDDELVSDKDNNRDGNVSGDVRSKIWNKDDGYVVTFEMEREDSDIKDRRGVTNIPNLYN